VTHVRNHLGATFSEKNSDRKKGKGGKKHSKTMLPPLDLSCLEASAPLARPRAHAVGAEAGGQALVDALGGGGGSGAGPSGKASNGPAASSFALPAVANVSGFALGLSFAMMRAKMRPSRVWRRKGEKEEAGRKRDERASERAKHHRLSHSIARIVIRLRPPPKSTSHPSHPLSHRSLHPPTPPPPPENPPPTPHRSTPSSARSSRW
jgi:hypothetical protein